MQICVSDEQAAKADSSRIETTEPSSNVTFESPVHSLKHELQIILTDAGRQIDCSDEQ
jgi:hypothetical protein